MLSLSSNPLLQPRGQTAVESELRRLPHLRADRRHDARLTRRLFRDARKIKSAAEAVGKIPDADETLHLVVSGRFALFHFVPAVLALAAAPASRALVRTSDRVNQVLAWIVAGASEHEITEAAETNWPGAKARALIVGAMKRLAAAADADADSVRGWAIEATRHVYQQALAAADFATALRAIKQLQSMTRGR